MIAKLRTNASDNDPGFLRKRLLKINIEWITVDDIVSSPPVLSDVSLVSQSVAPDQHTSTATFKLSDEREKSYLSPSKERESSGSK